jgi:hypothetical protein
MTSIGTASTSESIPIVDFITFGLAFEALIGKSFSEPYFAFVQKHH